LGCVSVWRQGNAGKPTLGRISNVAIARHSQARQSRSEGETVSWNWRTSEIAMSFLQGFEHDCFISYRHLDDIGLDGIQGHGWVTRFYKAFEATLNQCLGQPSAVFLDPQLDGGSELAPALRQIVCASAVLVPIVSPGYLNSPKYCGEEVNSFREQAKLQGRWSVGNRVLAVRKVVIQPLENDYHNQYPVDEPGYWFFEIDTVTKKSRKFEVGSDGFLNRLSQLADDTAKFLTTLQAQRQSKSTSISVKDADATKKEILLACDASGFDGAEKVKLVSCVAVDQPEELSSRMARFKATLAIDRAFVANADLVDRVRRAGLRYENDEAPLRDRVADELAVLPWDGYVSFADAAFWAQKSEADTILELLHGALFACAASPTLRSGLCSVRAWRRFGRAYRRPQATIANRSTRWTRLRSSGLPRYTSESQRTARWKSQTISAGSLWLASPTRKTAWPGAASTESIPTNSGSCRTCGRAPAIRVTTPCRRTGARVDRNRAEAQAI
jgi:hypothetical protein